MRSVEHLVEHHHIAQESKELLAQQLIFEEYQKDFSLDENTLEKSTLLDVGTGKGNFIRYLQETLGNKNSYGIDADESLPVKTEPYLVSGDMCSLSYLDNSFDITLSRDAFGKLFLTKGPAAGIKMLSECVRVTKPGGTILYSIKKTEGIRQEIAKETDEERRLYLLQQLTQGIEREAQFIRELQAKNYRISVIFHDTRRTVKIQKPEVQ
jgi:ubiquinone/menaquinone biosynthesis C-methylase UbiE